jgi:DNA transformation protein and related proteins
MPAAPKQSVTRSAKVAAKNSPRQLPRIVGVKRKASQDTLESLKNLGPESAKLLIAAGIETPQQLKELGAVGAYVAVKQKGLQPSLNLLYAIEAALRGITWTELPYHVRASLTLEADAYLDAVGVR